MSDCLFCGVANKKIKSKSVYENEIIFAFEDINPQAPVHIVIIPKKHIGSISELKAEDASIIGELIIRISKIALQKGISDSGFRVVANTGEDGGQTVKHLHFHLLGGRQFSWPPG